MLDAGHLVARELLFRVPNAQGITHEFTQRVKSQSDVESGEDRGKQPFAFANPEDVSAGASQTHERDEWHRRDVQQSPQGRPLPITRSLGTKQASPHIGVPNYGGTQR